MRRLGSESGLRRSGCLPKAEAVGPATVLITHRDQHLDYLDLAYLGQCSYPSGGSNQKCAVILLLHIHFLGEITDSLL